MKVRFYDNIEKNFLPDNFPIVMDIANRLFFITSRQGDGELKLEGPIKKGLIEIIIEEEEL